jgi:hypothetical protein
MLFGVRVYALLGGYASNNPDIDHNGIHFFGKRDGIWYYVVVEIN